MFQENTKQDLSLYNSSNKPLESNTQSHSHTHTPSSYTQLSDVKNVPCSTPKTTLNEQQTKHTSYFRRLTFLQILQNTLTALFINQHFRCCNCDRLQETHRHSRVENTGAKQGHSFGAVRPAALPQHTDTRLGFNPVNTRVNQRIQTYFRNFGAQVLMTSSGCSGT